MILYVSLHSSLSVWVYCCIWSYYHPMCLCCTWMDQCKLVLVWFNTAQNMFPSSVLYWFPCQGWYGRTWLPGQVRCLHISKSWVWISCIAVNYTCMLFFYNKWHAVDNVKPYFTAILIKSGTKTSWFIAHLFLNSKSRSNIIHLLSKLLSILHNLWKCCNLHLAIQHSTEG